MKRLSILLLLLLSLPLRAQDLSNPDAVAPFTLDGSVGVTVGGYHVEGIEERLSPLTWTVNGSLTPTLYGVALPVTFIVSEEERSFRQPFNQFGMSPQWNWITLHAGHRSLSMSRYSLAGQQFLGGGIELSPGPLRASFAYGEFQRAVEEDTTISGNIPAYRRMGWGGRVGLQYGTDKVGISLFHSIDDTLSLRNRPEITDVTPAENSVMAVDFSTELLPGLVLDAEAAASIYTRDVTSPLVDLDSSDIPGFLGSIQDVRLSTTLTSALRAGVAYRVDNYGIRLGYERIEPDFISLGASYFPTDVQNITVDPSATLFDGSVQINGSIGFQRDNLVGSRVAQTDRVIGSGNVSWQPNEQFGLDAQFTNYSTDQSSGQIVLNDTVRIRNVTRSLSISPRLILADTATSHSIFGSVSYQDFRDANPATRQFGTDNSAVTGTLIYMLNDLEHPRSAGASFSMARTFVGTGDATTVSLGLNGSTSVFEDDALTLGAALTGSRVTTGGIAPGSALVFNESITAGYRLGDDDQISLTSYATQSRQTEGSAAPFSEVSVQLGYTRNFSIVK